MSFKWNESTVKSRFWNAQIGNHEIKTFTPKEIINNPNHHQFEGIVSALCKTVSELVTLEEERTQRMMNFMNKNPDQMELFKEEGAQQ